MPSLNFLGKTFVQNHHLAVPFRQLIPKPELSCHPSKPLFDSQKKPLDGGSKSNLSLHDNLIIQGDNLDALKALLPIYSGKVKCIYIDPPYNTGNEGWVYNDNVKAPLIKEWLGKTVGKEGEDLTRHDKWLCMMMPRLKLLRELLSEDGVIFVSIDDNEQAHLKLLMDEVFGEQNFVSNIIWEKIHSTKNDAKYISDNHEYITFYTKNIDLLKVNLLQRTVEMNSRYSNPDNDLRGDWTSSDLVANEERKEGYFEIKSFSGKIFNVLKGKHWVYSKENMLRLLSENRIWFGKTGDSFPRLKRFLSDVQQGKKVDTLWKSADVGNNQEARREIKELFTEMGEAAFNTPKPASLIKRVLELSTDKDSIILDSFAGSGTTAQAVLELNKVDGGNRKFILVEMEDYANNITAERVRRVINGVPNSKKEYLKEGLGGTFSYFQLGSAIEMESLLDGTNLPDWTDMARYLYFTATGENIAEATKVSPSNDPVFIGSSSHFNVYLIYQDNLEWLKKTAFNSDQLKALPEPKLGKRNLVFAPSKYVDDKTLRDYNCVFQQLPYEIYKMEK